MDQLRLDRRLVYHLGTLRPPPKVVSCSVGHLEQGHRIKVQNKTFMQYTLKTGRQGQDVIFELQKCQNWLTISLGSNLQDTLRASHLLGQLDVDVLKFVSSVHSE